MSNVLTKEAIKKLDSQFSSMRLNMSVLLKLLNEGDNCNCEPRERYGKERVYCHKCGKAMCLSCSRGYVCKECEG